MNFPSSIIRVASRVGNTIQKYSPQIMMAVGAVTSVAAVVEAVKQTPKAIDILDKHKDLVDKCHEALALNDENYTEDDMKKDLAKIYIQTGTELAKIYAMPLLMEATSLLCFFNAHRIMSFRNKQLTATLAAATDAYNNYRNRVIESIGEDKEEQIRLGLDAETRQVEVTDAKGKTKLVDTPVNVFDVGYSTLGPWDLLWCEDDINYDQSEELNDMTIANVASSFTRMIYGDESHSRVVDEMPTARMAAKFVGENEANKITKFLINGHTQANKDRAVIIQSRKVEVRYKDEDGNTRYKNGRILTFNGDGLLNR